MRDKEKLEQPDALTSFLKAIAASEKTPSAINYLWLVFALLFAAAGTLTVIATITTPLLSANMLIIGGLVIGLPAFAVFIAFLIQSTKSAQSTMDKWRNLHWGWKAAMAVLILLCFFAIASPMILPLLGISTATLMTATLLSMTLGETLLGAGLVAMTIFSIAHLLHVQFSAEPNTEIKARLLSPNTEPSVDAHIGSLIVPQESANLSPAPSAITIPVSTQSYRPKGVENSANDFVGTGKTKEALISKIADVTKIERETAPISIVYSRRDRVTIRFSQEKNPESAAKAQQACLNKFAPFVEKDAIESYTGGSYTGLAISLPTFQKAIKSEFSPPFTPTDLFPVEPSSPSSP